MEYRFLGKTGLKVSEIAFGPGNNNLTDDADGIRLIEQAFDLGINVFDTANFEKGGKVEQWLGTAFRERRDEVVIATRFAGDATRKHIVTECEKSLKRLGTDYIDLFRFQNWQPTVAIEESLEALTTLVHQGKILYAGCTGFKTYQMANTLRIAERYGFTKIVAAGAKYNLLGQDIFSRSIMAEVSEFDLIPFCTEEKLGLIPFRPLAGGLLTGKYRPGEEPPSGTRYGGQTYHQTNFAERARPLLEVVEKLRPLAQSRDESLAQFAIAWILSKPVVSSVLVGANTLDQLKECASIAGHKLTPDELRQVDDIRGVLPGCVTIPSGLEAAWIEKGYKQV